MGFQKVLTVFLNVLKIKMLTPDELRSPLMEIYRFNWSFTMMYDHVRVYLLMMAFNKPGNSWAVIRSTHYSYILTSDSWFSCRLHNLPNRSWLWERKLLLLAAEATLMHIVKSFCARFIFIVQLFSHPFNNHCMINRIQNCHCKTIIN